MYKIVKRQSVYLGYCCYKKGPYRYVGLVYRQDINFEFAEPKYSSNFMAKSINMKTYINELRFCKRVCLYNDKVL